MMTSKGSETAAPSPAPSPAPRPSARAPSLQPRGLQVPTEPPGTPNGPATEKRLAKINLCISATLFVFQLVGAACLCRPVVVMAGLWVALLVLGQAVLALHASTRLSHAVVVGSAWYSGVSVVVCLGAAAYLFSGHVTLACISTFHRLDHPTMVRLYVVEVLGLVGSLPCLGAAIVALLSACLAARAACPPKSKLRQPPVVLYLPRWDDPALPHPAIFPPSSYPPQPFTPPALPARSGQGRASPPPAYTRTTEESFA